MNGRYWVAIVFALFCILFCFSTSIADTAPAAPVIKALSPMDTIRVQIDQIIIILNDAEMSKPENRLAQRDRIWTVAQSMFDFIEISRRTVGKKWTTFTEEEKVNFSDIFAQFLGNTYIDKVQGEYQAEKIASDRIVYEKELVKEPKALVRTKVLRQGSELPIDYRMKKKKDEWKVYDILVENGVSIVQNYRVQFQSFLQKDSPANLIAQLENKLKEQRSQLEN